MSYTNDLLTRMTIKRLADMNTTRAKVGICTGFICLRLFVL